MSTKLQILICTYGDSPCHLHNKMMPQIEGVSYLICWQMPTEQTAPHINKLSERDDIEVLTFSDKGLSKNRNHALDAASAPYILIADDDTTFIESGLREIIDTFDNDSSLDFATFRLRMPEDHRPTPPDKHPLSQPWKGYYFCSPEIALRLESVRRIGARFSEILGIGSPRCTAGEEEVFAHKLLRAGLYGIFRDVFIVEHPNLSTGSTKATDPAFLRSKGVVLSYLHSFVSAMLRLPLYAYRSKASTLKALWWMLDGYIYGLRHRSEL